MVGQMFKELGKKLSQPEHLRERPAAFEQARHEEVKDFHHVTTINEELAGHRHLETDVRYSRHQFLLNGERCEGVFPKFESVAEFRLPKELWQESDVVQFSCCSQHLALRLERHPEMAKNFTARQLEQIKNKEPRISGLTWHHNEIPGKMQLVDAEDHALSRHTGGRSLWGGGSECR